MPVPRRVGIVSVGLEGCRLVSVIVVGFRAERSTNAAAQPIRQRTAIETANQAASGLM